MGAWGTAISSNDTYADIYGEFFEHFDDGMEVPEISERLVAANQDTIRDPHDSNNFWFALAKAQWECKHVDPELFRRVEVIIESEADLEVWRDLDAPPRDVRKREIVLKAFLEKLRSEKPKARARKKRIIRQPIFEKGQCISFRLENGNFGGAIVLEAKAMVGFGLNLVATTRINQTDLPSADDFLNAEILVLNHSAWQDREAINWRYSTNFKKHKELFQIIGKLDIAGEFSPDDYSAGYMYGGEWKNMSEAATAQFNSEIEKPRPKKRVKVKKFVKTRGWKLW